MINNNQDSIFSGIQACIFDMDGVLVDNREFHKQAWARYISQYSDKKGFHYEKLMQQFFGKTNQKIFEFLLDRAVPEEELQRLENEKESIYRELYRPFIKPVDGLLSFLESLQLQDAKIGIGTSGPMENVSFVLEQIGAQKYFSAITDAGQVVNGKPDPEVFLKTAKKLRVNPAKCIVFEDSLSGVQSGVNAGMKVIGLTTEHTKEQLIDAGASDAYGDFLGIELPSFV